MIKSKLKYFLVSVLTLICIASTVCLVLNTKSQKVKALTKADILYQGCDISEWQPTVNYATMKSKMDFVILRIGYSTREDISFKTHVEGAKAVGLPLGVYIYTLATTEAEARNEANWVIETLASYGYDKGTFTYPIYFDYEESSVITSKTRAENTALINAFADTIRDAGYYPGLYIGPTYYANYTYPEQVRADIWVAAYTGWDHYVSTYHMDEVRMWQFDSGSSGVYNPDDFIPGTSAGIGSYALDNNFCFVDYPSIIQAGGYNGFVVPTKDTKVLGEAPGMNGDEASWTVGENLATQNNYDGDNIIYFNQSNSTHLEVGATFETTGKESSEVWGKFGISFIKSDNNGFWYYVDASGTEGTALSNITGTNLAVVQSSKSTAKYWDWQTATNYNVGENKYSSSKKITLKVVREGLKFSLYADGELLETINGEDYGIAVDEPVYASIRSFNVGIKVTDFYAEAKHNSMKIDGKFTDWERLPNYSKIELDKKVVQDSLPSKKNAVFYHRLTQEGLFIYAKAEHSKHLTGASDWWHNTNFEMFINGAELENQFYASTELVQGFTSFYFETTGTSGDYTTILEGFIGNDILETLTGYDGNSLKIGYAFKVDNGTESDTITPSGGTATSYWVATAEPRAIPFTVTEEKTVEDNTPEYNAANDGTWEKSGASLEIASPSAEDWYLLKNNGAINQVTQVTFKINGKTSTELSGKVGISYIDQNGNGFWFYADASGTTGTAVSNITGTSFGVVRSTDNYTNMWSESATVVSPINNENAVYSASESFTMKIERNNTVYKLYVNGNLVYTINDGTEYLIQDGATAYPWIRSNNLKYTVSEYKGPYTKVGELTADGDSSDWKALKDWNKVQESVISAVDKTNTNKGVWFYTYLTEEGLFILAEAKHEVDSRGYSDWWKNTNVEFYIGASSSANQFYATEEITHGFTQGVFVTSGSSGNYTSIFEGFIEMEVLVNAGAYGGEELAIGCAFNVDSLDGTYQDSITQNGGASTSWCANNTEPLLLGQTVYVKNVEEENPNDSSSGSNSSLSSSSSSSQTASSNQENGSSVTSSKQESSSNSATVSSNSTNTSNPTNTTNKNEGCKGNVSGTSIFIVLSVIAIVVLLKKKKQNF